MVEVSATIQQIHDRLYHMAKTIIAILENHKIPYSIAYGTLLGAVRHKGFIPWDEDFDMWLFEDSYDEAMKVLREELPEDMFLENEESEPKYFHAWAHVKDLKSEVSHKRFIQDGCYMHHGLYIDLYKLWKVKEREVRKFLNNENRRYILRRKEVGLIDEEEYKKRMSILEEDEEKERINKSESDEEVYALLNVYKCKIMYAKYVFPLKKYRFEDSYFFGINQAERFLTDLYGDYMTPTPPGERKRGLDSVKIFE
ncbi:MAG: LicD family protein [Lachnospiraceae bacterium]|nr:LicD family protein [Lachnospiraceae bacterium]